MTMTGSRHHEVAFSPDPQPYPSRLGRKFNECVGLVAKAPEMPQTVRDLCRRGIITDGEIAAAMADFLADPKVRPYRFGSGHLLDVAAVVEAHLTAPTLLADPNAEAPLRCTIIRSAMILAVPAAG